MTYDFVALIARFPVCGTAELVNQSFYQLPASNVKRRMPRTCHLVTDEKEDIPSLQLLEVVAVTGHPGKSRRCKGRYHAVG